MANLKERILSKSNSYQYYKKNNEELLKEIDSLNEEISNLKAEKNITLSNEFYKTYGFADSFCNWDYIKYFFRDDFEDKLKEVTKNLPKESKDKFKWYFLRALVVNMIKKDSLYFNYELLDQENFTNFKINNSSPGKIAGFNFTGTYNLHAFYHLNLSEEDKKFIFKKNIIDAGAFTGDTTLPLSKVTTGNIYAFEPFEDSFNLLKKNIHDNNIKNIIPIKKSLGNINGDRTLFLSGNNVQGITSNPNIRNYDNELKVQEITIDKFVEDNNLDIGFITVDVEGAEMDLLKGAINTIKTQKPILFISIYHKVSDYFDIIPWIANLDLGYEFKIVKEQPWTFLADTVVQCRIK